MAARVLSAVRGLTLAAGLMLVTACVSTPDQTFEIAVRAYETSIDGTTAYYARNPSQVGPQERKVIEAVVMSGREFRASGFDLLSRCHLYRKATGESDCPEAVKINSLADSLVAIGESAAAMIERENQPQEGN